MAEGGGGKCIIKFHPGVSLSDIVNIHSRVMMRGSETGSALPEERS